MIPRLLRTREITNAVRYILDECLPPVVRDRRFVTAIVARLYTGSMYGSFDLDFKRHAVTMSDEELESLYLRAPGCGQRRLRDTDLSTEQIAWVLEAVDGDSVLELGAGGGVLACGLARTGRQVTATEVHERLLSAVEARAAREGVSVATAVARAEQLPFSANSFDTVVAAHTLEHVRRFERAVAEMIRVARRRIVIVVPRQRYYRYTVDYHLHFFRDPDQLILRIELDSYRCDVVTGDLCYAGSLTPS